MTTGEKELDSMKKNFEMMEKTSSSIQGVYIIEY